MRWIDRLRGAARITAGQDQKLVTDPGAFVPQYDSTVSAVATAEGCVNLLAGQLAGCRRTVVRRGEEIGHDLDGLLEDPWPDGNAMDFWLYVYRTVLVRGNHYSIVRRSSLQGARVLSLTPALEGGVSFGSDRRIRYTLTPVFEPYTPVSPRLQAEFPSGRVVAAHWYGYGENGVPVSPAPLRRAMASALQAGITRLLRNAERRAWETGPYWGFIAQALDQMRSGQKLEATLAEMRRQLKTVQDEMKVPVLPPGVTPMSIPAFSIGDLNVVELLRWTVEDICRVYGVSPSRLGQMSGGGAGVRTQALQDQLTDFEATACRPVARMVDAALTRTLLTPAERMEGMSVMTETWPIGLGSMEDRANIADQLVARAPIMTPNEARRRLFGMPPVEGGDGLRESKGAPPSGGDGPPPEGGDGEG